MLTFDIRERYVNNTKYVASYERLCLKLMISLFCLNFYKTKVY